MGARIELRNRRDLCGEPIADVAIEHAPLHGADIGPDLALRALDEIPLLAIAGAFATGPTRVAGVGSLRSKESDRVAAIQRLLESVGIGVASRGNELTIAGGRPMAVPGARVETHGDHRIAMAASILSRAAGPIVTDDTESPGVSFPGFAAALEGLRG